MINYEVISEVTGGQYASFVAMLPLFHIVTSMQETSPVGAESVGKEAVMLTPIVNYILKVRWPLAHCISFVAMLPSLATNLKQKLLYNESKRK